jgi:hypothetical protein
MPPDENGQRFPARIVRAIDNHKGNLDQQSSRKHFVCTMKEDQLEEIFFFQ